MIQRKINLMDPEEGRQLDKMHEQLLQSGGITSFDTAYLERYTELLAKSLEGKGNVLNPEFPTT